MQWSLRYRVRRLRAYAHFLRGPFVAFLPLLLTLIALLLLGGYCFQHYYRHESLSFARALYITYCLVFMEHLVRFPDHRLLQLFYFVLPPLGLIVILDGMVHFGYRVLRRDEKDPEWVRAMANTLRNHVILCGLGRVGLRVLQQLIQLGEDVVVLEKDPNNDNLSFAKRNSIPVLMGCGREVEAFRDLNVAEAKSIILATDDDLANLEMALDARRIKPDIQVVMRMYDQEMASKIRDAFEIHAAFSTAALAAPLFATSSSDHSIENAFYVEDRLLVIANLVVQAGSDLVGSRIRDVTADLQMFFLSHVRDGEAKHFPNADTSLQAGDRITVQTDPKTLRQLHDRNKDEPSH